MIAQLDQIEPSERLPSAGDLSAGELLILLREDQRRRWQKGNPLPVEDYLEKFPQLLSRREEVLDLIYQEMLLRTEQGQPCRPESFYRRFPDYREELHDLMDIHQMLEGGTALQSLLPKEASAPHLAPEPAAAPSPTAGQAGPVDAEGAAKVRVGPPPSRTVPGEASPPAGIEAVVGSYLLPRGYDLEAVLGRGGMGIVYKARDRRLDREVAFKMILAGPHADADDLARFRTEAEAVARLQHPNIVQIFEVGEHGGQPFFCLEFVEGGSLAQKINATPQPPAWSASLLETLARAVHHAHQHGIVHRDLKPANVLLTAEGQPKITDFGLAKKLDVEEGQTRSGAIMGTPSYMAPEQAAGASRHIGPAADVYALGALLYEMLTGRPPFKGTTAMDTVLQVIHNEPVLPRQLRPGTPRDLETICLKCLHKEPARRYGSALDLADDLRRYQERKPIRARPTSVWVRTLKWARRRPAWAALVAVSVLAVVSLLTAGVIYGRYQAQRADVYQQELARVRHGEVVREHVVGDLTRGREHEQAGRLAEARTFLARALAALQSQADLSADDLKREAESRLALVTALLEKQGRQAAEADRLGRLVRYRDEARFHETLSSGMDLAASRVRTAEAARFALALYGLEEGPNSPLDRPGGVVEMLEQDRPQRSDRQHAELAAGCYELLLAWAESEVGDTRSGEEPAPAVVRKALARLERTAELGEAHGIRTRTLPARRRHDLALLGQVVPAPPEYEAGSRAALDWFLEGLEAYRANDFPIALRCCEEALRLQPDHFWAGYVQALCQLRTGRWVEARTALTACLNRRPDFAWPRVLRGFASSELGFKYHEPAEFAAARADFDQALDQDADPLLRYSALVNRGVLFIRQQRWSDAIADLNRAIRLNPESFQAYLNLAQAHQGLQQWDDALATLNRAIDKVSTPASVPARLAGQQTGGLGLLYESRARLHLERKDPAAARADFSRAIAVEPPGSRSARLVGLHVELGRLLHREKDFEAALKCYDSALALQPDFALAHRLRAETLLALNRHREAGEALDRYLKTASEPAVEAYQARGLLHAETRNYPAAIEMYTLALHRDPVSTRSRAYRGWTYLLMNAPWPALEDFQACLRQDPGSADALCGRGRVYARLRKVDEALADADAAEKLGPLTDRLHYNLACLYGEVIAYLEAAPSKREPAQTLRLARCRERALGHLERALALQAPERRASFWREQIAQAPSLASVRRSEAYGRLAALYDRPLH